MHAPPRPPSPDTVDQVISSLLRSVRRIHEAAESNLPEYTREREIAELELAASAIHDELLLRAARLKRHRNSSQWIYQLPQEIFAEILILDILNSGSENRRRIGSFRSKALPPNPPRRTQLCNVSHRFLQTIMGTPRIWSNIRWGRDDHTRCLQMSARAPLSIRCSEYDWVEMGSTANIDEFLKAVWDHSWRWEALSLHLGLSETHLYFLEFTVPQIRDVTMENLSCQFEEFFGEHRPVTCVLKIFGNPILRRLSLDGIGLQWNDLGLSHLKSLSLFRVQEGAPSLEKLVEILKMASGLEQLALDGVDIINSGEQQEMNPQPIHLTSLLSLWLDKLPSGLADYLAWVIRSPQLKTMHVHELFLEHFENSNSDQNPYHHLFLVLIPILSSSAKSLTLSNETSSNFLSLDTDHWAVPRPEGDTTRAEKTVNVGVRFEDPLSAVQKMVNFLTSNCIVIPLTISANGYNDVVDDTTPPPTPSFPAEVLGKLPMVINIFAVVLVDALKIITFLGSIRQDEETGRLGWACPKLKVLDFRRVEGLTHEHCQAFLGARYGDGNPLLVEGEVVHRPPMLEFKHLAYSEA
ncbi:hypothetical protein M407DRAFT_30763 [Tulasnella calospora MUT 4182]|uniref:F-box domain-containing protein n=1 Tax=Tulasnella calospora MUT 4182 TaxID=1051891 RepID=A0A0C3Q6U5_9AGAM|nr:hypothetical protein M407DRAFT_30763 [Tulasnella calospora MUT 4182]